MPTATSFPDVFVALAGKELKVSFAYHAGLVDIVKTIPGRRWNKDVKCWYIPGYGLSELHQLSGQHGFRVLVSPAVHEAYTKGGQKRKELKTLAGAEDAELSLPTATVPYNFQRAGIRYLDVALTNFQGALLADDMGLGKTFQALSLVALHPEWQQVLVVCPASLKYNWAREAARHYPDMTVQVIDGSPKERPGQWAAPARLIIANPELLLRDPEPFMLEWGLVIVDEATSIKNYKAQRTKKVKALKRGKSLALSGLPIENRLEELHSIMEFAMPGLLGSGYQFMKQHVIKDYFGSTVGYRGVEKVKERIRPHYLRRTKEAVLPDLPEKVYNDVWLELGRAEWSLYNAVEEQVLAEVLDNPKLTASNILTMILRLKQITSCARLLDEEGTEESKLSALKDILAEATEHKVVAFTEFATLARWLSTELGGLLIEGGVKAEAREAAVRQFQEDPRTRLFISTDAGAYGLTLTAADIIVHIDQPWNPARARQREDRLHRIGQRSSVQVINLLAQRTVDERIREVMHAKLALAGQVFEEDLGAGEYAITRADLLRVLGVRDG